MIGSFRKFAKTKFAGLVVFITMIPFIFFGMGDMFSSGNSNNVAKINKTNISTQDFIEYINKSNIPQETIRENINKNIIEDMLSALISTSLLDLEIKDFNMLITENTLLDKIRTNKNFLGENGKFERIKYEKFLLENNQSAPAFETRLRARELEKNLFDYVGAGTTSPKFLTQKIFEEENKKLEIDFFDLKDFYKKKDQITDLEIKDFLSENKDQLKVTYIDFDYAIINPINLIGIDEFNQAFFDKIDEIEIDISNNTDLKSITNKYNIKPINIKNFRYSENNKEVERKIFELKNIEFDIFENEDNYILYKINNTQDRAPDLNDIELRTEILELIYEKNKFDYNSDLLKKINEKKFSSKEFAEMGNQKIKNLILNSVKDNKKFEINAVELLYSLPLNSYTLINDEEKNIYIANIKTATNQSLNESSYKEYENKQNSNNKNSILKSYDSLLNQKYKVVLNQKTIERVKNFFQ
tara:strand:- start:2658 stop:4070 length:1413 start_codon:yes stop_codon:yes gene_type:complete